MPPSTKLPKELDLPLAFELTRKLVAAGAGPEIAAPVAELPEESTYQSVRRLALAEGIAAAKPPAEPVAKPQVGMVRYWLWRLLGRPAAAPDELTRFRQHEHERVLTRERNRVAELAKLTETLQRAHEAEAQRLRSAASQAEAEAAVLRQRVEELAKAPGESQRTSDVEMARLHEGHAAALAAARAEVARERDEMLAPLRWDLDQARARVAELETELRKPDQGTAQAEAARAAAEERARMAENKVELLKDALDLAKARAGGPAQMDHRFRDAKRAFARAFHPDHGGRDDAEKQRMFLHFWPEFERIERDGQ